MSTGYQNTMSLFKYEVAPYNRAATQQNLDTAFAETMQNHKQVVQKYEGLLEVAQARKFVEIEDAVTRTISGMGTKQVETYAHNDQRVYKEMVGKGYTRIHFKVVKGAYGDVFFTQWLEPGFDKDSVIAQATKKATEHAEDNIKLRVSKLASVLSQAPEFIKQYQDECKFINSNDFLKGKVKNV